MMLAIKKNNNICCRNYADANRIFFFFFALLHSTVCGILVLRPETEPVPPAVEAWSPNHWTTGEFPLTGYFKQDYANPLAVDKYLMVDYA